MTPRVEASGAEIRFADGSALSQALAAVGIVALVLAPLFAAVYLGRRMRRPAAPTAVTSARRAASAP